MMSILLNKDKKKKIIRYPENWNWVRTWIVDEIELDAIDDDALDASFEGRVTSGEFGDAGKVGRTADEERLVESQLSEGTGRNADHNRKSVHVKTTY